MSDPGLSTYYRRIISKAAFIAVLSSLLGACEQTDQLPIGAELTISPQTRSITVADRSDLNGNCFVDPQIYLDTPLVFSLFDGNGSPIGGADITVYVDYSGNTFPSTSTPVLALYDDKRGNGNGIIDDVELVSATEDDIAVVTTDDTGGNRTLLLRINASCPYRGEIFAFTGGVTAGSSIEILAEESTEPVANRATRGDVKGQTERFAR